MIQLQSLSRLAIVFCTAPLGIVGASIALNLAHKPFGFVALLGLIALAGMDMRNTVILVDQIENDVRELGLTRGQAIVSATVRRARPVVLTALAAILAMIPLSESAFWGPMAATDHGRPVGRDVPDPVRAALDLRAGVPQIAWQEERDGERAARHRVWAGASFAGRIVRRGLRCSPIGRSPACIISPFSRSRRRSPPNSPS